MFVKKCGAKARTNGYQPCRQPAMANGRCRLHGGKSSGPLSQKGIERIVKSRFKHGFYSAENINEREFIQNMIKSALNKL